MSNLPKINFRFSEVYDQEWKRVYQLMGRVDYPSSEGTQNYIKVIEPIWRKLEKQLLKEITNLTSLSWNEENIVCYIVGRVMPFADPLTIPAYLDNPDYCIDTLTHELIHRLFSQESNGLTMEKYWKYVDQKYTEQNIDTRNHILLLAIHTHILKTLFNKERLNFNIKAHADLPEYKAAWNIVVKNDYIKIIEEFNSQKK